MLPVSLTSNSMPLFCYSSLLYFLFLCSAPGVCLFCWIVDAFRGINPHTTNPHRNLQLKDAGKESSIRNFQDSAISTARPVIDLIDAIKPGSISYDQVQDAKSEEVSVTVLSTVH